jgi:hypothetical protein
MNKNQHTQTSALPGKQVGSTEPVPEYNFDDWAKLYEVNPAAFESRRQAVLAIELAKLGPRAARARVSLANLEETLVGKTEEERVRISTLWMADAATKLNDQLEELAKRMSTLQDITREHLTR